jgi:hypothetical protein
MLVLAWVMLLKRETVTVGPSLMEEEAGVRATTERS